ncbi:MAG: hypothetical protein K2Q09_04545, partial [Phycisphaerales bacterium]|nr:hypothetical protein [Phycisphaerales bacterium]
MAAKLRINRTITRCWLGLILRMADMVELRSCDVGMSVLRKSTTGVPDERDGTFPPAAGRKAGRTSENAAPPARVVARRLRAIIPWCGVAATLALGASVRASGLTDGDS